MEIVKEAGKENNYIFGATVEELESIMKIYDPRYTVEKDPKIGRVIRSLIDGTVSDGGSGDFRELYFSLMDGAHWHRADNYYVLGDSSSYYYSYDELNSMSAYDLYIARNEIYARHGRMFNRSDLQDYFNSQEWYTPLYSPSTFDSMGNQLNDCELKNVKLMKQVEADKGSPYL